ncbi:hypothetical protein BCR32DRAFT_243847 [Anaeromyces robustus]|uniref:DUF4604 domain-containing protein n=1 Tax=Anaeromyces robustus TaxID=1754192 RepID=A0A1Y1XAK8_9FUNG|nr:hypothetical protein BCR32DRAFT_243847 [Anaeromyces robustus]|eukprot:ORX82811.1 hypothetical protein BCR32DRAFT_243847 [Anaeromyces robustus]
MSEKRSSYQYRQSLSFIDKKPKFLQNFLQSKPERSEKEIEQLKKERKKNEDDEDDEQPQIVVLNEGKDFSKEEMEQYLLNNPDKTYDKNYKETEKNKIHNGYKNTDIDYNEYTFGNEIKRDKTSSQKVIFRKPISKKIENELVSSSKGNKRKNLKEINEKDNINDKDNKKQPKSKKHKKAKTQKSLLSFSMDDE